MKTKFRHIAAFINMRVITYFSHNTSTRRMIISFRYLMLLSFRDSFDCHYADIAAPPKFRSFRFADASFSDAKIFSFEGHFSSPASFQFSIIAVFHQTFLLYTLAFRIALLPIHNIGPVARARLAQARHWTILSFPLLKFMMIRLVSHRYIWFDCWHIFCFSHHIALCHTRYIFFSLFIEHTPEIFPFHSNMTLSRFLSGYRLWAHTLRCLRILWYYFDRK